MCVCVRVVVTHPTLLLSRGAHSALLVLLASPYRYVTSQTNADWLKISYDSQKRKCAKDPENEIIKQKTSARAEKRMNIVVSTADSLRLTSCHVVSFRFACSLSLSLLLTRVCTRSLTTCWAFWPCVSVGFAGCVPSTSSHWPGLPLETPNCCRSVLVLVHSD